MAALGAAAGARTAAGTAARPCARCPSPVLIEPVLLMPFVALFVGLDPMMERDGRRKRGTRAGKAIGGRLERTPFVERR